MEVDELRKRYAAGKRDFSWVDLRNADLSGSDFSGIQLYHANLAGANLTRTNLSKADLRRANLTGASLTGTNFMASNLARANLDRATVTAALFLGSTLPNGSHWKSGRLPPDLSTHPVVEHQLVAAQWSSQRLGRQLRKTRYFTQPAKPSLQPWQWGSIAALTVGYGLLGLLLSLHGAPLGFWGLTWLSSLLWGLTARSRWFVPLGAAIAVLLSVGISPWVFGAAIAVSVLLFAVFYRRLHHPLSSSLQEAGWGAGLVVVIGALIAWIVEMPEATLSGWLIHVPWLQQGLLVLGIIGVGLGSFSWSALEQQGLTKLQRFSVFAVVTLLGLLIGSAGPALLT